VRTSASREAKPREAPPESAESRLTVCKRSSSRDDESQAAGEGVHRETDAAKGKPEPPTGPNVPAHSWPRSRVERYTGERLPTVEGGMLRHSAIVVDSEPFPDGSGLRGCRDSRTRVCSRADAHVRFAQSGSLLNGSMHGPAWMLCHFKSGKALARGSAPTSRNRGQLCAGNVRPGWRLDGLLFAAINLEMNASPAAWLVSSARRRSLQTVSPRFCGFWRCSRGLASRDA